MNIFGHFYILANVNNATLSEHGSAGVSEILLSIAFDIEQEVGLLELW